MYFAAKVDPQCYVLLLYRTVPHPTQSYRTLSYHTLLYPYRDLKHLQAYLFSIKWCSFIADEIKTEQWHSDTGIS